MWITGGSRSCGLPSRSSSRVMRSSERSKPFGWSAIRRSISRSAALVIMRGTSNAVSRRGAARIVGRTRGRRTCEYQRVRLPESAMAVLRQRRAAGGRISGSIAATGAGIFSSIFSRRAMVDLQFQPRHHHVDHAVLHQIFGALEAFGQFLADGLLDDARAGKADQRAGFGDMHVAQHRIGGGDAAGGRVGQHDDIGKPGFLVGGRRRPWCAATASATGCLPACARRRTPQTAPAAVSSPARRRSRG